MARTRPIRFSDQIRQAIRESGRSPYRLGADSGVGHFCIYRFLSGDGMSTRTLDSVADSLGLEITQRKKKTAGV